MDTTYSANGQRQAATLNDEISTMWGTKPTTTPQKTSQLLRLIHTCHAALIHTCHAASLPFSNSAVSFVKVRVVAGNIRTASPTV
jgi:hypothetical protein